MSSASKSDALNLQRNQYLGNVLYIVVGIVTFIGLITSLVTSYRATNYDDGESQASGIRQRPTRLKTWFRRKFLLPALFGRKHVQPLGYYQFPTRGQTLMVVGYVLLNIVFLATDFPGDGRTIKTLSDRAGHLAVVNMPLYFLFAGRNNILIWVTSWPQRDFQVFHKWIARVSTLEAIIHSAGYGYVAAQGHWNIAARKIVWYNGISATVVVSAMLLFSVMSARKHCYELFLAVHILCAILFLVFLYHHLKDMPHHYTIYVGICSGIWALDRVLRVARLVITNKNGKHTARARIIPHTSTILLAVYPNIEDVGFAPGAHYFLYFPDKWCFWESHPFTALSWRPTGPNLTRAPPKVMVALEEIPDPELERVLESELGKVIESELARSLDPADIPLPASRIEEISDDDDDEDGGMTVLSSYNDKVIDDSDEEEDEGEDEEDKEKDKSDEEEKKPRRHRKERRAEEKRKKEEKRQKKEERKAKKEDKKPQKEEKKAVAVVHKDFEKPHKGIQKMRIVTTSSARRGPQRAKLTFLIHPRKGMTRDLLNRLQASPHQSLDMPVLLEGPYGIARPVQAFPTVVIIAGGVGISTALPYLQQQMSPNRGEITRRFLLIWSVRDGIMAQKILASINSLGLSFRSDVELKLFITRAKDGDVFRFPIGVKVRYRRPKIERTILREARSRIPGTPMAVVACGGAAVVDCARKGAVMALKKAAGRRGMGEIVYWEEGYGW